MPLCAGLTAGPRAASLEETRDAIGGSFPLGYLVTVIVSQEGGEYAFHRGRTPLQVVAATKTPIEATKNAPQEGKKQADAGKAGAVHLFANVRGANDAWNDDNRGKLKPNQGSQKEQGEMGCRLEGWK